MFEFNYGFATSRNYTSAASGLKVYINVVTTPPITISSAADEYTCTVTLLASDQCQVNGTGNSRTSMPRRPRAQCA